ncbi:hypothetical protein [Herbiconiux daphne]|uniref:Uncharacterized protein n=1 Tax=Herbiconiux daphne TaxID=2970914 RepID=A0ABT2H917_9MICO|nr:hypothetical protein [Herbiconiux daphne]MCS5736439.1 hypothetical protein [Herbiconiux daphne]
MDKARFVISVRQAISAANHKLDVMVKPDVVIKEYRKSVLELLELFKRYNSNFTDNQWAGKIANQQIAFTMADANDVMYLRIRLSQKERSLPSIIELTKGKVLK